MNVPAIPPGYHSITPYLIVRNAVDAIDFYQRALGAEVTLRLDAPDGRIGHAELLIGNSHLMLADEYPDMGSSSPETLGGSGFSLMLYVEDADSAFARAIEAGATELRPVEDQFYGDRAGTLKDPFGHVWTIGSHIEDVAQDELERRMADMMS